MDQGRTESWTKSTRVLEGDSNRMFQVTVSILVWPGVDGEPIPTSSEGFRLAPGYGMGVAWGPAVQAQLWPVLTRLSKNS